MFHWPDGLTLRIWRADFVEFRCSRGRRGCFARLHDSIFRTIHAPLRHCYVYECFMRFICLACLQLLRRDAIGCTCVSPSLALLRVGMRRGGAASVTARLHGCECCVHKYVIARLRFRFIRTLAGDAHVMQFAQRCQPSMPGCSRTATHISVCPVMMVHCGRAFTACK